MPDFSGFSDLFRRRLEMKQLDHDFARPALESAVLAWLEKAAEDYQACPAAVLKGRILSGKSYLAAKVCYQKPCLWVEAFHINQSFFQQQPLDAKQILVLDGFVEIYKKLAHLKLLDDFKAMLAEAWANKVFVLVVLPALESKALIVWADLFPEKLAEALKKNQLEVSKLNKEDIKKLRGLSKKTVLDQEDLGMYYLPYDRFVEQIKNFPKDLQAFAATQYYAAPSKQDCSRFLAALYFASFHKEYQPSENGLPLKRIEQFWNLFSSAKKQPAAQPTVKNQPFQAFFSQNKQLIGSSSESLWQFLQRFLAAQGSDYWLCPAADFFLIEPALLPLVISKEKWNDLPLENALWEYVHDKGASFSPELDFFSELFEWQILLLPQKNVTLKTARKVLQTLEKKKLLTESIYEFLLPFMFYKDLEAYVKEVKEKGAHFSLATEVMLNLKQASFAEALTELPKLEHPADEVYLDVLLKAKNIKEMEELEKIYPPLFQKLDAKQLVHVFQKTHSSLEAEHLLQKIPLARRFREVVPFFQQWILRLEDYHRIANLLPEPVKLAFQPEWRIFLKNTPRLEEALQIWAEKKTTGGKPTSLEVAAWLKGRKHISDAEDKQLTAFMEENSIPKDANYYFERILKASQPEDVFLVLEKIHQEGLQLSAVLYVALFRKLGGRYSFPFYQIMLDQGIVPNQLHFKALIQRSRNFNFALRWYYEMLSWGINPLFDIKRSLQRHIEKEDNKPLEEALAETNRIFSVDKSRQSFAGVFLSISQKRKEAKQRLATKLTEEGLAHFSVDSHPKYKDYFFKFLQRERGRKVFFCLLDAHYLTSPYCWIELFLHYQKKGLKLLAFHGFSSKEELLEQRSKVKDFFSQQPEPIKDDAKKKAAHPIFNEAWLTRELVLKERFYDAIDPVFDYLASIPISSFEEEADKGFETVVATLKDLRASATQARPKTVRARPPRYDSREKHYGEKNPSEKGRATPKFAS